MYPMSPIDALFLHAEDGVTHMHIGSCSIFAGPPPEIDDLTALIESKLPLLTRYRQKVRFVPAALGHPVWVDDPTSTSVTTSVTRRCQRQATSMTLRS